MSSLLIHTLNDVKNRALKRFTFIRETKVISNKLHPLQSKVGFLPLIWVHYTTQLCLRPMLTNRFPNNLRLFKRVVLLH